ncbi:uncharacterized protein [Temnothorax longispinosus]|uniref:uncharacterized protein n=1 Tax=Temnothorax longispinosus TaxID=300112 RepID=UPI003A9A17CB
MSVSDTSIEVVKERLTQMSFIQLQEEAKKYGISLSTDNTERWIDAIIDRLIRSNQEKEKQNQSQEAGSEVDIPSSSAASNTPEAAPEIYIFDSGSQSSAANKSTSQPYMLLVEQMRLQREEQIRLQKEQMAQQQGLLQQLAQQQALMQQMFTAMNMSGRPSQTQDLSSTEFDIQNGRNPNTQHVAEPSVAAIGHSVKFLSSAIPSFGGTEEEDVSLWLEKIESIAANYNLSPVTRLSAATTKLNKAARRWFDLCTGDVNGSWDAFKEAIVKRFKRRVLFNVVMQKINNRIWNFSAELFQDYAMDKLALIQPLRLRDEDIIHLLISGITNFSMKSAAATIHTDSVDYFLEEMHHLTSVCGVPKSAKFDKLKEPSVKPVKPKDIGDAEGSSNSQKQEIFCVYCRNKGHLREDCIKLKKKEQAKISTSPTTPPVAAVATGIARVTSTESLSDNNGMTIVTDETVINVVQINNAKYITTDFDSSVKQRLIEMLQEIEETDIPLVDDDYSIKVNLKDDSIFAYAPRRIARWILKLQDYRFKVEHRDGRRMAHVDALSRVVGFTDSIPLEKELQYRQLQDPKLKLIAEKLEQEESDEFELIDGLVFKKGIYRHRFVVPEHHLVAVAAPWANGMVERVNRFLKSSLKKLVDEQQFWNIHLDTVQYVMNNTYHKSLGASPSKILLGIEQRNNADVKLVDFLREIAGIELDIQKSREASRDLALEATNKIKEYNKIYYDERHKKPTKYEEGDLVLIRDTYLKPGEDKKLKSNYKGPYRIAKVLDKNRYVVKDIPGYNITSRVYDTILSSDRIKPWIKPIN